jgi:CBS domain containing-hemolysin-like protein
MDVLFWLAVLGLLAGSLSAIAARALREFSRRELEELSEHGQTPDRFADILHHHERVALAAEMAAGAGFALAAVCAGTWCLVRFAADGRPLWPLLAVMVLAFWLVGVVAAVLLPWLLARSAAAPFLYYAWPIWKTVGHAFSPLVWAARGLDGLLRRLAGRRPAEPDEETIEEEIRTIVSEGHREGLLEEDAREMIEGVIELGDAVVSHIMTPRTEMHMVQLEMPWEELLEDLIESGHSRVPVYDKSRDDIAGVLHIKDLLPELAKGDEERKPIAALLRKPLFVPETKPVDELLSLFQKSHTHIAVVLDEYAGVSGLVTIEDALEEIVGEIVDEYDKETEAEIRKIDDDVCEALGRAHVDQINEMMGFDLPESETFDTIGGFVFAELGRVPAVGEKLTWQESVRVTVLEASRRRVNRVRLERIRKESPQLAPGH